jgi:hypothetical protein
VADGGQRVEELQHEDDDTSVLSYSDRILISLVQDSWLTML